MARANWENGKVKLASEFANSALTQLETADAKNAQPVIQSKFGIMRSGLFTLVSAIRLTENAPAESLEAAQRAIEFDSTNREPKRWRAHALLLAGKMESAKQDYLGQWALTLFSSDFTKEVARDFERIRQLGAVSPQIEDAMQEVEVMLKLRKP